MNNEQIDNTDYYRLPSGRQLEDFIAERHLTLMCIGRHYVKATDKHPHFCDELTRLDEHYWLVKEIEDKQTLARRAEIGNFSAEDVLTSELSELFHAITKGDTENAVEEAYDAIAVLLRIIDVLEHRQPLGRLKEGAE